MPAIIAKLVIRMGRRREVAPVSAAAESPLIRARSAKVTRRMAFATATPTAMMVPMKLWRFSVVPVSQSVSATPASTAGTVEMTTSERRTD